LPTLPVTAIMTRTPRTIAPDDLVAKALEMQETAKITSLVVVEEARPVGLVHFLDLLRAGAAWAGAGQITAFAMIMPVPVLGAVALCAALALGAGPFATVAVS